MPIPRFDLEYTALIIVDMQEKLVPVMDQQPSLIKQIRILIQGCGILKIPILITEQYPQGLGKSIEPITQVLPDETYCQEKKSFSALTEQVYQQLISRGIRQVILAGIETHICLQQTALDTLSKGLITGIVVDATSSRNPMDKKIAIKRMIQAGAIPLTSESILFELQKTAASETFKAISKLVK